MTDEIKTKYKIAFVGDEGVGKTSIIMRMHGQDFQEDLSSSFGGSNYFKKFKFNHDNSTEIIEITSSDLAGNEKFRTAPIFNLAIQDASAIAIVFDPSNMFFSNDDLVKWVKLIKEIAPKAIIALVKNKSDSTANKNFKEDSIKELVNQYEAMYFVTSALKNEGIIELYEGLINKITGLNGNLELIEENENEKTESINIGNESKEKIIIKRKKRWCCC